MCTMIAEKIDLSGSGKGQAAWFTLDKAYVSYDHTQHAPLEHALNIDFVCEADGPSARLAVELTVDSARRLVASIEAALLRAAEVDAL